MKGGNHVHKNYFDTLPFHTKSTPQVLRQWNLKKFLQRKDPKENTDRIRLNQIKLFIVKISVINSYFQTALCSKTEMKRGKGIISIMLPKIS